MALLPPKEQEDKEEQFARHGLSKEWRQVIDRAVDAVWDAAPKTVKVDMMQPVDKACLLVQFVGGKLYFQTEPTLKDWHQLRLQNVLRLITLAHDNGANFSNFEMILCLGDCPHQDPSNNCFNMVTCSLPSSYITPAMVQWYDMRDGLLIDVDNRLHNYATYARNLSWESRANVAVFRGNLRHTTTVKELPSNTFRLKLNSTTWLQYGRGKLVTLRQQANASQYLNINLGRGTQADVVKDNWNDILASLITDEPQQLSMFEQARLFKYTVYAEGNCGWADRLKWYLSLGLVPILQETRCKEWYTPMMKPWVHYLPVDGLFNNLTATIKWAQQNDVAVRRISEACVEFANNVISLASMRYYTERMIQRYIERLHRDNRPTTPLPYLKLYHAPPLHSPSSPSPSPFASPIALSSLSTYSPSTATNPLRRNSSRHWASASLKPMHSRPECEHANLAANRSSSTLVYFQSINNPYRWLKNKRNSSSFGDAPFKLHLSPAFECSEVDDEPWECEFVELQHRGSFQWDTFESFHKGKIKLIETNVSHISSLSRDATIQYYWRQVQRPFVLEIDSAFVLSEGPVHQYESNIWNLNPFPCKYQFKNESYCLPVPPPGAFNRGCNKTESSAIFVVVQSWPAYYHRMVEDIPKIIPFIDLIKRKRMKIVISRGLQTMHFFLLQLVLNIETEDIINLNYKTGECVEAEKVFLPQSGGCGTTNGLAIRLWRSHLHDAIERQLIPTWPNWKEDKRSILVIKRPKGRSRSVVNHGEFISELRRRFPREIIVEFDGMNTPSEQIRLFYEAKLVVGPHGAGFSNMLFLRKDSKLVEVFLDTHVNICFADLASQLGLEWHGLLGKAVTKNQMIFNISRVISVIEVALSIPPLPPVD